MNHFVKDNLDKFLLILIFLLLLSVYMQHTDNKTLENTFWMSFGGVLTILGVKRSNSPTIQAGTVDTDSINVGEK